VERRYPRKLLNHLQTVRGYTVAETTEGIYTISGDIIPIQIIDSRRLSADENLWLKSLSNKLNSLEVTQLSEEIVRQKKDAQIAAYLNVIRDANTESIQEAMEMGQRKQKLTFDQVCENVGWAAKWEARGRAEGEARGKAEGIAEGIAENNLEIARNFKKMGLPVSQIAEGTGLTPAAIKKL
jgi:predicted transposase/invertase (TIGR01784 family)